MTTSDLIRRARELARLAEKATPGPWIEDGDGVSTSFSSPAGDVAVACTVCNDTDRSLIAAAPDMARLLGQLADELDWIIKWALERCYQECGQGLLERGMHGPNCLIDEIGLDDLVEHEEFQRKRTRT